MTDTPIEDVADDIAAEDASDILLLNGSMFPDTEDQLRNVLAEHTPQSDKLTLILVTPGGLPDSAYRIAMMLRTRYKKLSVCIPGWCKSAGTLLAIAGDELLMGERGEMGPLDVQIAKRDELAGDRDSGLVINEALARLRAESFDLFSEFLNRIVSESPTLVTFRTAADVAANLTIGLMSPIFEKIDPLRMGADARAMNIGEEYAVRLNALGKNLKGAEALSMLLNGYPSHSFVIDIVGAASLFTRVQPVGDKLAAVISEFGQLALLPAQAPKVCFTEGDDSGKRQSEGPLTEELPDSNGEAKQPSDAGVVADDGRGDREAGVG